MQGQASFDEGGRVLREETAIPSLGGVTGQDGLLGRFVTAMLIASVAAAPLLVPPFLGNTVPGDLINMAFIFSCALLIWRSRLPVGVPLAAGYVLFLLGGLLALPGSANVPVSVVTIVQDIYLFLLFLTACNYLTERMERPTFVATVWVAVGLVVGALTWLSTFGYPASVPKILGWPTVGTDGRAHGTFRNPNIAANYLVVSLFILWAAPRPRSVWLKLLLSLPCLLGIGATYSNTGIASLVAGSLAALGLSFVARRRFRLPAALGLIAAVLLLPVLLSDMYLQGSGGIVQSVGRTQIFSRSLGRFDEAAADRAHRWQQAIDLFGDQIILGVGPAGATEALKMIGAPMPGELHNDYLSGFVERGLVGGFGLIFFFGAALICTMRLAVDRRVETVGWRPAALFGGVVAMLLSAMTIEVLHFRHLWLFLALVMAVALQQGAGGAGEESRPLARRSRIDHEAWNSS
jgi:O-antigen ligase